MTVLKSSKVLIRFLYILHVVISFVVHGTIFFHWVDNCKSN